MDITELMIGNYAVVNKEHLCIPKGTVVKVIGIDSENTFPEMNLKGCVSCIAINDLDHLSGGIWVKYLDPLPLTTTMLNDNEWSNYSPFCFSNDYVPFSLYKYTEYNYFSVRIPGEYEDGILTEISYVHELQNLCRLCGVKKEFKINL